LNFDYFFTIFALKSRWASTNVGRRTRPTVETPDLTNWIAVRDAGIWDAFAFPNTLRLVAGEIELEVLRPTGEGITLLTTDAASLQEIGATAGRLSVGGRRADGQLPSKMAPLPSTTGAGLRFSRYILDLFASVR